MYLIIFIFLVLFISLIYYFLNNIHEGFESNNSNIPNISINFQNKSNKDIENNDDNDSDNDNDNDNNNVDTSNSDNDNGNNNTLNNSISPLFASDNTNKSDLAFKDLNLGMNENNNDLLKLFNNRSPHELISSISNLVQSNLQNNPSIQSNKDNEQILKRKKKIKCKFFPSYSEGFICPDKYSSHLGATFSAKASSGLTCNGKNIKSDRAKAYAIVRNGSIRNIKIINKGSGYQGNPLIKVIGNGKNARLKCDVSSSGSIKNIEIINRGMGYEATPKIIIEKPNGLIYCHLCCLLED